MSIIRAGFVLAAAVMLLPVEEKKQAQLASTASLTAERTASFCERNPSTCATGNDLWALFLRKAEFGVELGAKLLREQLLRGTAEPQAIPASAPAEARAPAAVPALPQQARVEPVQQRRTAYPMDHPPKWR